MVIWSMHSVHVMINHPQSSRPFWIVSNRIKLPLFAFSSTPNYLPCITRLNYSLMRVGPALGYTRGPIHGCTPAVCAERLAQSCSRQATIRRRPRVVPRFPFNGIIVAALPGRHIFSCGFARHSATPAGEVELLPADCHLKKILHCATFSPLMELLQLHYSVALFLCGFAHHSTTLAFCTKRL